MNEYTWVTQEGEKILIWDLTDQHLNNLIKWLERTVFPCGSYGDGDSEEMYYEEECGTDLPIYPLLRYEQARRVRWRGVERTANRT